MEVLEETNPLQTESKLSTKAKNKLRNSVGRPTRKNEILFSPPPKSIISQLLSEEKLKKKDQQDTTELTIDKTTKPVKRWTCELCPEGVFYKKNEYKEHLMLHKVYKCDYPNCSYTTKFTSNLKTHKRIHTSDYPYACDECTFRSRFINSLKTHKRLHGTDRPYECQHCEYKCNSGSNLKKHFSRKHSNIPNTDDNINTAAME